VAVVKVVDQVTVTRGALPIERIRCRMVGASRVMALCAIPLDHEVVAVTPNARIDVFTVGIGNECSRGKIISIQQMVTIGKAINVAAPAIGFGQQISDSIYRADALKDRWVGTQRVGRNTRPTRAGNQQRAASDGN
jgi:hypothetical protein